MTSECKKQTQLEIIANNSTRNDRVSWNRKMDNMVKLLASLRPIEDQILDLMLKKQPIMDEVSALRDTMVKECVHPIEHLVLKEDVTMGEYVECKFCYRKFNPNNIDK